MNLVDLYIQFHEGYEETKEYYKIYIEGQYVIYFNTRDLGMLYPKVLKIMEKDINPSLISYDRRFYHNRANERLPCQRPTFANRETAEKAMDNLIKYLYRRDYIG